MTSSVPSTTIDHRIFPETAKSDPAAAIDSLGQRRALLKSAPRFDVLADAMPHMVWSTLPDGDHDYYNARWYEFTGMADGSTDGEGWADMFHADDQPEAWRRWRHSLATGEPYEVEYRLRRHDGVYRWVLGRAMPVRDGEGRIVRWIGTCTDIQDARDAAHQTEILSRELSHRIKNIFSVISALIRMTSRSTPSFAKPAAELQDRIAALGRAHEFVRPHSEYSRPHPVDVSLRNLLGDILGPYPALSEGRIVISGGDFAIGDRAATPVALVIHELATNSLKYGALSNEAGTVRIAISGLGQFITLLWVEDGGPAITVAPESSGFGSRLTSLAVEQQLGGSLERHWLPQGLRLEMQLRCDRLTA